MLSSHSARTRLFLTIVRQNWFRPIAKFIERITIPGILLHYALRKKCIVGVVRSALTTGATQVVIIGAGFDPLTFQLNQEFPRAQYWEIDHPATQHDKLRSVSRISADRLHFVAMDLSVAPFDSEALIRSGFEPTQRAIWIAEGLLMYLTPNGVSSLLRTLKSLSAPGSQLVFTFMEKQDDGRVRFDSQSKLVDWWLRRRGEPFLWGSTRSELADFVRPWRVIRFFDHQDLRELASGPTTEAIAKGEVICLAES